MHLVRPESGGEWMGTPLSIYSCFNVFFFLKCFA